MSAPFQKGDRIKLVYMGNDPCPVECGATGTVTNQPLCFQSNHQSVWQVCVEWDNGRSLNLVVPPDYAVTI